MCTLPITGGGIMDYKANTPIYLQVIDDIKRRILTGEIKRRQTPFDKGTCRTVHGQS